MWGDGCRGGGCEFCAAGISALDRGFGDLMEMYILEGLVELLAV